MRTLAVHISHPAAAHNRYERYLLCVAKDTAKEVFFMEQMKSQFTDSWKELRNLRTLVVTAMMTAVAVVLGFYSVQLTEFLKISFAFLANEVTALLFGPAVGGIMAGVADLIKYLLKPTGPFFFGFTFDAIVGGVIYGIILYRKPMTLKRIFAAKLTVMIIVNVILNTYWLCVLYGSSFAAILPVRIMKECLMLPVETVLLYTVVRVLTKAKVLAAVRAA